MRRTSIVIVTVLTAASALMLASACSESTDGATPATLPDAVDGAASGTDGEAPKDDGGKSSSGGDATIVTGDASVLINEIHAGDDWVELVATGNVATDISGFRLADTDKDTGGPKLAEAAEFPAGTILSPKAYALVQAGGLDGGVGKACPDGGQSYCINAEFGISNKDGETLFLVDKSGVVVGKVDYPAKAAGDTEAWGRIPSGDPSSTFTVTQPTPGAANVTK